MTSTTINKKGIVDFLWEWAEGHDDWGKLLISKIVTSESELSSAERAAVFDYFLESIGQCAGLPTITITKPIYIPTNKQVELEKLSDITGVNRLAKSQSIHFSKNITVVFGENGTGKTGYGRILKSLGFSYDSNNKIISNIFGGAAAKTARINFKANGTPIEFNWDGTNKHPYLDSISVFNNNCVQISLADRQLIVSPIGFHLFNLVTAELNEMMKLLTAKIAMHPVDLTWSSLLNPATPQQLFIASLSAKSSEEELEKISTFISAHEQELLVHEKELSNLNNSLIQKEIQQLSAILSEIVLLIGKIKTSQAILTTDNWEAMVVLNQQIDLLEINTQTGIKEIAARKGIEFYATDEFQEFLQSAENYIKIINNPTYPGEQDNCVYCLQPLDSAAKDLLINYRLLLNDKTQENLSSLKKKKEDLVLKVTKIETNLLFHQPAFGLTEEQQPVQPELIKTYNSLLDALKTTFTTSKIQEKDTFLFDYNEYIDFLSKKSNETDLVLSQKKESLLNLAAKEAALKIKIAELKDRKVLCSKVAEVKTALLNYKIIAKLNAGSSSFNSASISRKTTQAREELVSLNFDSIFKTELKAFRKTHLHIDLSFGTERGNSKLIHRMKAHSLADILSEGEQKAIALAEFLTELQLDNIKAPVIFDDPVNSLDHTIIDDVARRLLTLSGERQVVIFTHSVLLFNCFLYFSKQPSFKALACKFYNSKNEYDETGFITEAEEEKNSVKDYISKINSLLNNTPKDRSESEVAEDGYGYLRSVIELFVEHEIFCGTVKRYQKNISLTNFAKINGVLLNSHKDKLNEIFERCCGYIKGHSNPTEIYNDPTLTELKADVDDFKKIRDEFLK